MKAPVFTFLALLAVIANAGARIGDTPDQLKERHGAPIAESADRDGNGLRIYRTTQFKEIRVTFVAGKSQLEKFTVADGVDPKKALDAPRNEERQFRSAMGLPAQDDFFEWNERTISIGLGEESSELKFVGPTNGQMSTYVGILEIKKRKEQPTIGVLRDGDRVVEVVVNGVDPGLDLLKAGRQYSVTVLDQHHEDLRDPIAVVGKREHVDWFDAVDDVHDRLQLLVRIESNGIVVFDHAVCGAHHIMMEQREVPIAYGMLAPTSTEIYCDKRFPHFREYAAGGCVEGEKKTTRIYICPACVSACKESARTHPEPQAKR